MAVLCAWLLLDNPTHPRQPNNFLSHTFTCVQRAPREFFQFAWLKSAGYKGHYPRLTVGATFVNPLRIYPDPTVGSGDLKPLRKGPRMHA